MCLAKGPQRSDAGEARTCGPSVSSQALYHWATALPINVFNLFSSYRVVNEYITEIATFNIQRVFTLKVDINQSYCPFVLYIVSVMMLDI